MVRSMTGFGQALHRAGTYRFQVEIKSVNHRYLETSIRMPREWLRLEDELKKRVSDVLLRGRVDVNVTMEREPTTPVEAIINWSLLEGYYQASLQVSERFNMPLSMAVDQLLQLPDVVSFAEVDIASDEWMKEQLLACLDEALQHLLHMREAEGQHIQHDVQQRLQLLAAQREEIVTMAPRVQEDHYASLQQRLLELLGNRGFDEQRLIMEAALLAERSAIDEELIRLESHLKQCEQLLHGDQGAIGRKLDFLIQEMNREVNTIGSKTHHLDIVNIVVNMKAELEKIREQIQNIE